MITWIQRVFIKNGRWLFGSLLVIVMVAFVFTINPAGGFGDADKGNRVIEYFGINLASQKERQPFDRASQLSVWMLQGRPAYSDEQAAQVGLERIAYLSFADRIGVPGPTEEQFTAFIRERRVFQGPGNSFSPDSYSRFVDTIKSSGIYSDDDVVRTLIEDYRIEQLRSVVSGPGYVVPFEARKQYENRNTILSVDAATFSYESFDPQIATDDESLQAYYKDNDFKYEAPPQMKLSAILFDAENYLAQVNAPDETALRAYYEKDPERFKALSATTPENFVEVAPETVGTTFEMVRDEVNSAWRIAQAARIAVQKADDFTVKLYYDKVGRKSGAFDAMVKTENVALVDIPAFSRGDPPTHARLPKSAFRQAFQLNDSRYFSDVILLDDGAAVLIHQSVNESRIPNLDEVRQEVLADYMKAERKRLFVSRGENIKSFLEEAVAAGQPFSEAAETMGMKAESYQDFTSRAPPSGLNRALLSTIFSMAQGEISPMVILSDDGNFVLLTRKEAPASDATSTELETAITQLASRASTISGRSFINEIISRELALTDSGQP